MIAAPGLQKMLMSEREVYVVNWKILLQEAYELLQKKLPDYARLDGFYKPSDSTISTRDRFRDGEGDLPVGMGHFDNFPSRSRIFFYNHGPESNEDATLEVRLHSPNSFGSFDSLHSTDSSTVAAKIEGGLICGYVPLRIQIPHPKVGEVFGYKVTDEVIAAVLYGRESMAEESKWMINDWDTNPYISISNPTIERMKAANSHAKDIAAFFADNAQAAQRIALAVQNAINTQREDQTTLAMVEKLFGQIKLIEEKTGYTFHTQIRPENSYFSGQMFKKELEPVRGDVESLVRAFPRELMEFASQKFYNQRGSFFE